MSNWYLLRNGQANGPYPEEQVREWVRAGQIAPDEKLNREGDPNWLSLDMIPEFAAESRSAVTLVTASTAASHSVVTAATFRHPNEMSFLVLGISILIVVLVTAVPIFLIGGVITGGIGFILNIFFFIPLWTIVLAVALTWERSTVERKYPRVTAASHPDIYSLVERSAAALDMTPPPVLIATDRGDVNACAYGVVSPVVILNHGLLTTVGGLPLAFVIGHEFGHIKASHSAFRMILHSPLLHTVFGWVLWWPVLLVVHLAMLMWDRAAEHTSDRAGLIACGDLGAAIYALVAVHYGAGAAARTDLASYAAQVSSGSLAPQGLDALMSEHPGIERRVRDLVQFVQAGGLRAVA